MSCTCCKTFYVTYIGLDDMGQPLTVTNKERWNKTMTCFQIEDEIWDEMSRMGICDGGLDDFALVQTIQVRRPFERKP